MLLMRFFVRTIVEDV